MAPKNPKHIFKVKYNLQTFLVIMDSPSAQDAISKAWKMAQRDLVYPEFKFCEYVGQEDV